MDNIKMAKSYLRQAEERLKHAKEALSDNYAYVIRQSQEAVELALKASLRIVGIEPPKFHDVGPILRRNANSFPEWFRKEIDKMASISRMLRREREPSMYGDEELALSPDELYTFEDAKTALDGCVFVLNNCKKLLDEVEKCNESNCWKGCEEDFSQDFKWCGASKMMLPKKLKERVEEESKRLGISEEEFIVEALSEYLKIDPEYRVEVHLALSEKYLKEAEEFLEKGDYTQASEKVWGAASQIVKALAVKRGKALRSHRELHGFVSEIRRELKDPEISTLWLSANSLHQNFYENWLPKETVKDGMENVRKFVKRIKELIK